MGHLKRRREDADADVRWIQDVYDKKMLKLYYFLLRKNEGILKFEGGGPHA